MYTIECVAHTLNNVVQDILSFILYIDKIDRTIIQDTINDDLIETSNQSSQDMFFYIYIYIYNKYINNFNNFTFDSKSTKNRYDIQIQIREQTNFTKSICFDEY
jgi:hypothetical protein